MEIKIKNNNKVAELAMITVTGLFVTVPMMLVGVASMYWSIKNSKDLFPGEIMSMMVIVVSLMIIFIMVKGLIESIKNKDSEGVIKEVRLVDMDLTEYDGLLLYVGKESKVVAQKDKFKEFKANEGTVTITVDSKESKSINKSYIFIPKNDLINGTTILERDFDGNAVKTYLTLGLDEESDTKMREEFEKKRIECEELSQELIDKSTYKRV